MIGAALLIVVTAWTTFACLTNCGDVRLRLVAVAGYTEDVRVWMPFRLTLELTNAGRRSTAIRRIDIEPDLEGANEAYNIAAPYELSPPILLEPGASTNYEAVVTVLNAAQLVERTYPVIFRIRLDTDDGAVTGTFAAELDYFHDPSRRVLRGVGAESPP